MCKYFEFLTRSVGPFPIIEIVLGLVHYLIYVIWKRVERKILAETAVNTIINL